jgi:hypothetical protein
MADVLARHFGEHHGMAVRGGMRRFGDLVDLNAIAPCEMGETLN